uniref:Uncharacterized protein n=1 Tax=Glossina palpalis gambiensis TaxID=67801 RepID=A0A1B0AM86_9MUSC
MRFWLNLLFLACMLMLATVQANPIDEELFETKDLVMDIAADGDYDNVGQVSGVRYGGYGGYRRHGRYYDLIEPTGTALPPPPPGPTAAVLIANVLP